MEFDARTRKLINELSRGLAAVTDPYRAPAEKAGFTEAEAIVKLREMIDRGIVRRNAAIIRQRMAGYSDNAMCVFAVAPEFVEPAGSFAAALSGVSHCYERDIAPDWPYNFYAMVHGRKPGDCEKTARDIAAAAHCGDFRLLKTLKEYKKKNAEYFSDTAAS